MYTFTKHGRELLVAFQTERLAARIDVYALSHAKDTNADVWTLREKSAWVIHFTGHAFTPVELQIFLTEIGAYVYEEG